ISESTLSAGWTATAYDFGEYPTDVASHLRDAVSDDERSIVVWEFTGVVDRSVLTDDPVTTIERGLSLGYTVVIPEGDAGPAVPGALLEQEYVNTASIVRYSAVNNASGTTPLVPEGGDTLSTQE